MALPLYSIVSVQNPNLCLGVTSIMPGTGVVLLPTRPITWLTTWTLDPDASSGLISNAMAGAGTFVLDVEGTDPLEGAILVLNPGDPERPTQQWTVNDLYIGNDAGLRPLFVTDPKDTVEAGDPIYWLSKNDQPGQRWRLQRQEDSEVRSEQGS